MEWSVTYRIREIDIIQCKIFPPTLNDCWETMNMNIRNQKAYLCKQKNACNLHVSQKSFCACKESKDNRPEILAFGFNFTSKISKENKQNP